jgi:hypothetical protein
MDVYDIIRDRITTKGIDVDHNDPALMHAAACISGLAVPEPLNVTAEHDNLGTTVFRITTPEFAALVYRLVKRHGARLGAQGDAIVAGPIRLRAPGDRRRFRELAEDALSKADAGRVPWANAQLFAEYVDFVEGRPA